MTDFMMTRRSSSSICARSAASARSRVFMAWILGPRVEECQAPRRTGSVLNWWALAGAPCLVVASPALRHHDGAVSTYRLGPTTTRTIPSGHVATLPAACDLPIDFPKASDKTVQGVLTQSSLPMARFRAASASSSDTERATTVTPAGWPPTDMVIG